MKALEAIKTGTKLLKEKNIPTYILDAELILSKSLNKSREEILVNLEQNINKKSLIDFNEYLLRRSKKEPIAYLLEEKEFWSKKFFVNKNTLIPRPETELLVEKLLTIFKKKRITILDVGTGTGCIIISLLSELKNSTGMAVDISSKAIVVAKKNACKFKLSDKIKFFNKPFEDLCAKKFDLIVSNPPYIPIEDKNTIDENVKYEPEVALFTPNSDPLFFYKKILDFAFKNLNRDGKVYLEINPIFVNDLTLLFQRYNIDKIDFKNDFRGKKRLVRLTFFNE